MVTTAGKSSTVVASAKVQPSRIISWNLAARKAKALSQIKYITSQTPDVIALQEVTLSTAPLIMQYLKQKGWKYIISSLSYAADLSLIRGKRRYGLILAAKIPITYQPTPDSTVPWLERFLVAKCTIKNRDVFLSTTHIPPGSRNGWMKIEMLDGIYNYLHLHPTRTQIFCGDLNTPQAEESGKIISWAWKKRKNNTWHLPSKAKKGDAVAWDNGESQFWQKDCKLHDAFRLLHGEEKNEYSWFTTQNAAGRRFDHMFVSSDVIPLCCEYLHTARTQGLSDHSPLIMDFILQ